MKTISFFSYKGGTGRTLLLANVAKYLASFGQRVVTLDFDLEAPGLHYKFSLGESVGTPSRQKGVVDYLYEFVDTRKVPANLQDYVISIPVSGISGGSIHLMPAGTVPSPEYWRKLSRISWHDLFYAENAPGVALFLEMKEQIRTEFDPDFLLIDSRTGITEIGGVATSILPDKVVCLMLNNPENLDGTRAVLRSVRRNILLPGWSPPEIVPVLSRVPSDNSAWEAHLTEDVRRFLNEIAEKGEDTLDIPEVLVLHSDPDLQVKEYLAIDGDKKPDESILLPDYLRLFNWIIPRDVISPQIGQLAMRAKMLAFDDPNEAQKTFESLAQLDHPDAYRELLKFYRLRHADLKDLLRVAAKLWEITRDSGDVLLRRVVEEDFRTIGPTTRELPGMTIADLPILDFVDAIWRATGGSNPVLAGQLAESYGNFRQWSKSTDVLVQFLENVCPHAEIDTKIISRCVTQLMKYDQFAEAKRLLERFNSCGCHDPELVVLWAKIVLVEGSNEDRLTLSERPLIDQLIEYDPITACRVLLANGMMGEADALSEVVLHHALDGRSTMSLNELAQIYSRLGKEEQFEAAIAEVVPKSAATEILQRIGRTNRGDSFGGGSPVSA
jgi:MinD-like ATPase involved in chromosome partitioning or flagellar assembly